MLCPAWGCSSSERSGYNMCMYIYIYITMITYQRYIQSYGRSNHIVTIICTHTYVYIYIYIHTYVYIYIYIYIHIHMHMHIHARITPVLQPQVWPCSYVCAEVSHSTMSYLSVPPTNTTRRQSLVEASRMVDMWG